MELLHELLDSLAGAAKLEEAAKQSQGEQKDAQVGGTPTASRLWPDSGENGMREGSGTQATESESVVAKMSSVRSLSAGPPLEGGDDGLDSNSPPPKPRWFARDGGLLGDVLARFGVPLRETEAQVLADSGGWAGRS